MSPPARCFMMSFCYLKGELKCRSLLATFFLLFPLTPSFLLCTTFLPHFFSFIFCASYPSERLYLVFSIGKEMGHTRVLTPWKGVRGTVEAHWPCQSVLSFCHLRWVGPSLKEFQGHSWPRVPWENNSSIWPADLGSTLRHLLLRGWT